MTRDFRAYWFAEVTSVFGSMFTLTAVGIVAVETYDANATQIGLITAAGTAPVILFGLVAGALADRVRRPRRLLIACDASGAAAVLTVAVGVWAGWAGLWWLAGLSFALGAIGTVVSPVYFTHLSAIVGTTGEGGEDVVRGRGRLQSGQYGARIVGRAAAGPVIAVFGPALSIVIDAVTYVISLVLLAGLRTPDRPAQPQPVDSDAAGRSGWRALTADRFLGSLVWFLLILSGVLGAVTTLTTPFLLRGLDIPVTWYGAVMGTSGIAGLIGSLVATRLVGRFSGAALTVVGFGAAAASLLVLPTAGGPAAVAVPIAGLGVAAPVLFGAVANIGLVGVMTTAVPGHLMGRAVAAMTTATTVCQLVGAVGGGYLGDLLGIRPTLWLCAVAALTAVVVAASAARSPYRPRHAQRARPVVHVYR